MRTHDSEVRRPSTEPVKSKTAPHLPIGTLLRTAGNNLMPPRAATRGSVAKSAFMLGPVRAGCPESRSRVRFAGTAQVVAGPCKVPVRSRVLPLVQGNSMQVGPRRVSSTHAPHRPTRPTLVPRVIPTRVNVANAVGPAPSAFHGGPSCPKAMAKWCLYRSFRMRAAIPRGSWLTRR